MTPGSPSPSEGERQEKELLERVCEFEKQARRDLEQDGCPPCYPASLGPPFLKIPEEYTAIMSYWIPNHGTTGIILHFQLGDWNRFRSRQQRARQYYLQRRGKNFSEFQNKISDLRQRHGLDGDVSLHLKLEEQSRLQNWIEYQYHHLLEHENLEEKLEGWGKELEATCVRPDIIADVKPSWMVAEQHTARPLECRVPRDPEWSKMKVKYFEGELNKHQVLLQWIEQQRIAMIAEPSTHAKEHKNHKDCSDRPWVTRQTPALSRGKRKSTARSVLSPIRSAVSKHPPRKRNLRPRNRDVSSDNLRVPLCDIPRTSNSENKPQHRRTGTPLHPECSYKVSKTSRQGRKGKKCDYSQMKPLPTSQPHGTRSRKPPDKICAWT